jgi:hypothetical protein
MSRYEGLTTEITRISLHQQNRALTCEYVRRRRRPFRIITVYDVKFLKWRFMCQIIPEILLPYALYFARYINAPNNVWQIHLRAYKSGYLISGSYRFLKALAIYPTQK